VTIDRNAKTKKIPIEKNKSLDFRRASDRERLIEIESKGTVCESNSITPSISNHKKSITGKKESIRRNKSRNNMLIGIIASFPIHQDGKTLCRLVDPPADESLDDPKKIKLIKRLYYYHRNLQIISRSHSIITLGNRINVLTRASDYTDFNNLPLVGSTGETIKLYDQFFTSKATLGKNNVVGRVLPISKDVFFYYGFDADAYRFIIKQDFEAILTYKSRWKEQLSREQRLFAWVDKDDLRRFDIPIEEAEIHPDKKRVQIMLRGFCYVSDSGRVIGMLKRVYE